MARSLLDQLPEVFLSTTASSAAVSRAVKAGEARKLGPRLYTTNLTDPAEAVVRRNLWPVVGLLFPDTVVSHRTALDARPTPGGTVFLTGSYDRLVQLPGLRIRQIKGSGPLEGDTRFVQRLWLASQPRAFLECLGARRARGPESPALTRGEIETRLDTLIRRGGEGAGNALRDRARRIASALGAPKVFGELDALIGTLLGTRESLLTTAPARARAAGEPYDPGRLELFRALFEALSAWPAISRPDPVASGAAFEHLAFVDAYFSNFIEGTEFEVEEALAIIFEHRIPRTRPEDAHDILGTYRVVGSPREMRTSAFLHSDDFPAFLALLKRRHATIMEGRPEKRPGEFKTEVNRAGQTIFVEPDLVAGTLRQGFEMFRALAEPFQRAAFMMFLVAEVHPFEDGNGRLARAMMNAELIAGEQRRILVPTAYREDYLLALRALSRERAPSPYLRMLDRAQQFAAAIDFTDLHGALAVLRACRAFDSGPDARLALLV